MVLIDDDLVLVTESRLVGVQIFRGYSIPMDVSIEDMFAGPVYFCVSRLHQKLWDHQVGLLCKKHQDLS